MNTLLKRSLVVSAVLHSALLAWALIKIGTPASFDMSNSESLPVEFVPISEITQIQQGDKEAPKKEKSATAPTKRKESVANAENTGDNDVDLKSAPKPIDKPSKTEAAAAPKPTEKPTPTPEDKPNEVKDVAKEETDVAEQKPEPPKPDAKPEVKPEPTPAEKPPEEPKPEEKPPEDAPPKDVPVPAPKPKVEKPPEEKKPEKKPEETKAAETKPKTSDKKKADTKQDKAKSAATQKSDFNADQIANLLNKTDKSADGAKASSGEKAFGGKKTTGGETLSQSELDGLKGQIAKGWTFTAGLEGADEVVIELKFSLDESGNLVGEIDGSVSGGPPSTQTALLSAAKRAIRKAVPFQGLPAEKYDSWKDVSVQMTAADAGG